MTTLKTLRPRDAAGDAGPKAGGPAPGRAALRIATPDALVEAGLATPGRLADLEAVAGRYAIGLTPAVIRLIDRDDPRGPDRAPVRPRRPRASARPGRNRRPDRRRRQESDRGARPSLSRPRADQARCGLRRLLPLLLPPRARRAGLGAARRGGVRRRARLYSRAAGDLGDDPDRRRSLDPVAAPHRRDDGGDRRDRPRPDPALAHPPAGRRARAGDGGDGARARRPARRPSSSPSTPTTRAS